jgi:hypothetical protein
MYAVFIVGGLLVVAARFHAYTFRPVSQDPRWERGLYWLSSLAGTALATAATIPHGWVALPIAFVGLWSTFLYSPRGPWRIRRWER